jgi:hypothetical protein
LRRKKEEQLDEGLFSFNINKFNKKFWRPALGQTLGYVQGIWRWQMTTNFLKELGIDINLQV